MEFIETAIDGAFELRLDVRGDHRGRFMRAFCAREFDERGLCSDYVQMNHSITATRGTVRGLHYQTGRHGEVKVVNCVAGRVWDVAVDLREQSCTYRRWAAVDLDGSSAFYIPAGCAHGFQALTDDAHLIYLHSEFYAPEAEAGLRYDDPGLSIAWPLPAVNLSERDLNFPVSVALSKVARP